MQPYWFHMMALTQCRAGFFFGFFTLKTVTLVVTLIAITKKGLSFVCIHSACLCVWSHDSGLKLEGENDGSLVLARGLSNMTAPFSIIIHVIVFLGVSMCRLDEWVLLVVFL